MRGARRLNVHVSPRSPWPFATLVFAFFLLSAASNLPTFISFLNRPVYYAEDNGGRLDAFSSFECSFLWHLNSLLFYIAWEAAFRWSRSLTKAAIFSRGDSARREALLANCARRPGDTRGCNGGRFFIFFQLNLISYPHQCWPVRTCTGCKIRAFGWQNCFTLAAESEKCRTEPLSKSMTSEVCGVGPGIAP